MPYTVWKGYIVNFLECLTMLLCNLKNPVIAGLGTAFGIVLGNLVINYIKYENLLKDVSKVFDLVISNQLDDLYNMSIAFVSIHDRLTTRAVTIIGLKNDQNNIVSEPQRTDDERRGLLKDLARIKDRESIIRNDDLYKAKLSDIKLFKSSNLEIVVRYFRKLKILLEDIRNFTSYDFPSTIEECAEFNWKPITEYKTRTNFLIARIYSVICFGLIAKKVFNSFNAKADGDLSESYTKLSYFQHEIQNESSIYSLLKEEFDIIKSNFK